jgi:hypothetical protein
MKKILTTIAVSIITAGVIATPVGPPIGPFQCKLTAITQDQSLTITSSKTNTTATATNTTIVLKATTKKAPFGNPELFALIENSFNTNFPAGSQLAALATEIVIVDSTGTNVIFNPSTVMTIGPSGPGLQSSLITQSITDNKNGQSVSGNVTDGFTSSGMLNYDDTLQTTHDGTHSQFQIQGMLTVIQGNNLKTHAIKFEVELDGTGEGPVQNVVTVLTGTIKGKSAGAPPPP